MTDILDLTSESLEKPLHDYVYHITSNAIVDESSDTINIICALSIVRYFPSGSSVIKKQIAVCVQRISYVDDIDLIRSSALVAIGSILKCIDYNGADLRIHLPQIFFGDFDSWIRESSDKVEWDKYRKSILNNLSNFKSVLFTPLSKLSPDYDLVNRLLGSVFDGGNIKDIKRKSTPRFGLIATDGRTHRTVASEN